MKNRYLERLKRKRLRHEKTGNMIAIDPITGDDIGSGVEDHHIAGKRYHDDTIPLNPDGHHLVSDAIRDFPTRISGPVRDLDRIGRYLLGVIVILDFVLDRLWEMGNTLIATARAEANREFESKNSVTEIATIRSKKSRGKSTDET